jgi:WD40 repeat protein
MAFFQWRRIDPAAGDVEQALVAARAAAGGRNPTRAECLAALTQAESPAGSVGWGPEPTAAQPFGCVACSWWTDPLGRRHWYIEGDQYRLIGNPELLWRCRDGVPPHPLWVLSPRSVALRGDGPDATLLVVCDCGEVGTPEEIAWTGDCCGPCFDRRRDGTPAAVPLSFRPHECRIAGLAFTEDGCVLSCGWQTIAPCLLDPRTGQQRHFTLVLDDCTVSLALLPGNRAVVGYHDRLLVCWDLNSGEEVWRAHIYGELMGLAASPLGDLIAVDCVTVSWLLMADSGEGEYLSEDMGHFEFSPDGEILYAYDWDTRTVAAVDPITMESTQTGLEFGEPEEDDCYSLACCPTRPLLVSGGDHGRVRFGDLKAGRWRHVIDGPPGLVSHLAFTPDGLTLATGHEDRVVFWDPEAGTQRGMLRVPGYGVASLAFSPDGETLAIGDTQGTIRLWPWRRLLGPGDSPRKAP